MAIEKLTQQEIMSAKKQFEAEDKLPSTNRMIEEMAEPYMEEARSLLGKGYEEFESAENIDENELKKLERNIKVVADNQQKLNELKDIDAYIANAVKKGLTEEEARDKWMNAFLKHVKDSKEFNNLSEEELRELSNEEGV